MILTGVCYENHKFTSFSNSCYGHLMINTVLCGGNVMRACYFVVSLVIDCNMPQQNNNIFRYHDTVYVQILSYCVYLVRCHTFNSSRM